MNIQKWFLKTCKTEIYNNLNSDNHQVIPIGRKKII